MPHAHAQNPHKNIYIPQKSYSIFFENVIHSLPASASSPTSFPHLLNISPSSHQTPVRILSTLPPHLLPSATFNPFLKSYSDPLGFPSSLNLDSFPHPPQPSMTNVLPLLPDDLAPGLRPLDFSNLLPFSTDPVVPAGLTASPSQPPWPAIPIFSPICSTDTRLSGPNTDLLPDNSPWLSNLSPLFRHVTERENDFSNYLFQNLKSTDFPPDFGSTIASDVPAADDPAFSPTTLTFTASSAATNLDDVHSSAFPTTSSDLTLPDQPAQLQNAADAILAGFPLAPQTAESQPMTCDEPMKDATVIPEVDTQSVLSPVLTTSTQTTPAPPGAADSQSVTGGSHTSEAKSTGGKKGKKGSPSARKASQTMSSIDKAAERRRKNRESSSRCYYNRKRIIESLDKQISAEKTRLTSLYDRALELRHENARLKKDVVTRGIPLPTKPRMMRRAEPVGSGFAGYVGIMGRSSYRK